MATDTVARDYITMGLCTLFTYTTNNKLAWWARESEASSGGLHRRWWWRIYDSRGGPGDADTTGTLEWTGSIGQSLISSSLGLYQGSTFIVVFCQRFIIIITDDQSLTIGHNTHNTPSKCKNKQTSVQNYLPHTQCLQIRVCFHKNHCRRTAMGEMMMIMMNMVILFLLLPASSHIVQDMWWPTKYLHLLNSQDNMICFFIYYLHNGWIDERQRESVQFIG